MKKTGEQAQGGSKPSEVRSSQLVPVNNASRKVKATESKSSKPASKSETEFDYRSLGKISSGNTSSKSKTKSKSGKKSDLKAEGREYGFVKGGIGERHTDASRSLSADMADKKRVDDVV